MRPRDWFSVSLRVFGLWIFFGGFNRLESFLYEAIIASQPDRSSGDAIGFWLWDGAVRTLLGLYFVFGAEGLTRWVYGELKRKEAEDEDSNPPS